MNASVDNTAPLVTIVTVTLNPGPALERCVRSVRDQRFDRHRLEYLVVDGGSTDGTAARLQAWQTEGIIDRSVSEQDRGIYDGMNKGLRLARGIFVAFLNADDWYEPDAIEVAMKTANACQADYVYSDVRVMAAGSVRSSIFRAGPDTMLVGVPYCHQSLFCRRSCFEACGGFDLRCGLAADQDQMMKLMEMRAIGAKCPGVTVNYSLGGATTKSFRYLHDLYAVHAVHAGLLRHFARQHDAAAETYLNMTMARVAELSQRGPDETRELTLHAIERSLAALEPWTWQNLRWGGRRVARGLTGLTARLAAGEAVSNWEIMRLAGVTRSRWWAYRVASRLHLCARNGNL